VILENSTISGNQTGTGGDGGDGGTGTSTNGDGGDGSRAGQGGGIFNVIKAELASVTIAGNLATSSGGEGGSGDTNGDDGDDGMGGGIFTDDLSLGISLTHTILGDNSAITGMDCHGTLISLDYNLIENTIACTVDGTTDNNITGQDPDLAALKDNGGPTLTHYLTASSPAIDAGDTTCYDIQGNPLTTDQRGVGYNRPENGSCDIGALEVQTFDLAVTLAGTGSGTVNVNPPGTDCSSTCNQFYTEGEVITLTATADANSTFAGWDKSGPCSAETGTVCSFRMDGDYNVTATFDSLVEVYTLTVTVEGDGTGTVTSSPAGINCGDGNADCSTTFADATVVTLTATTTAGIFGSWDGDCSGAAPTCQVTMSARRSVTATFVTEILLFLPLISDGG
jgi:hypothetical protein